jgi:dTDP-4-dehydrorhamnose reductase
VSSDPISKYDLLNLVAKRYEKNVAIEPYDEFRCDRSLDSSRFRKITGYVSPSWPEMIDKMWRHNKAHHG